MDLLFVLGLWKKAIIVILWDGAIFVYLLEH